MRPTLNQPHLDMVLFPPQFCVSRHACALVGRGVTVILQYVKQKTDDSSGSSSSDNSNGLK